MIRQKMKKVKIDGINYTIGRTHRFRTSGGFIGRKGIEVFKKGDTSQTSRRFESMKEFRDELRTSKRLKKKRIETKRRKKK